MHGTCDISPNMKNTRVHHPQNEQGYSKMNGMGRTDCPVSVEHSNMSHFLHQANHVSLQYTYYAKTIQQLWHISLDTSECWSYCDMNQQADAYVCAKHINHCAIYVNIKHLPQTFTL